MNEDPDRIEGLERLARRQKPQRDLWPGIQSRLQPRRRRWAVAQFALAASVVAGMAGVLGLQLGRAPHDAGGSAATMAYASAGSFSHDSRAIVKANLAIVHQAEKQLRQALAQDPDSRALRELLASTESRGRSLRAML